MAILGPGDRVECINDAWGSVQDLIPNRKAPQVGDVVTISKIVPAHGTKYYALVGFDHRDIWLPDHFRPVREGKTDIDLFREIDRKVFRKVQA